MVFIGSVCAQRTDKEAVRFFDVFQESVRAGNHEKLEELIYFPFQTAYWVDGADSLAAREKDAGLLEAGQFDAYTDSIFNTRVKELLPQANSKSLLSIDIEASGSYYKALSARCDKGSPLYEIYIQYTEHNQVGGNYFGFVFGRVNSLYKLLSYYSKPPVN